MCFDQLYESAQRGELLLIDGGICHWHLRRDGQLTIREIIATRPGAGLEMLKVLRTVPGATSLYARCPVALASNELRRCDMQRDWQRTLVASLSCRNMPGRARIFRKNHGL